MIAWYWLIVAFFVGIVFATFTNEWFDYDNLLTSILAGVTLVVTFIPMSIYAVFFKLTLVHPVTSERFEEVKKTCKEKEKTYHLFGNLYAWCDPSARAIWSKFFLVRVKKTS